MDDGRKYITIKTNKWILQEQIIEADIKIEEYEMALESLQVVNNEMNNKLKTIEINRTKKNIQQKPFNFDTINPSDLNCLSKLRELMQQEIRLKKCINILESREKRMCEQLQSLFNDNDKTFEPNNNKKQKNYSLKQRVSKLIFCSLFKNKI